MPTRTSTTRPHPSRHGITQEGIMSGKLCPECRLRADHTWWCAIGADENSRAYYWRNEGGPGAKL